MQPLPLIATQLWTRRILRALVPPSCPNPIKGKVTAPHLVHLVPFCCLPLRQPYHHGFGLHCPEIPSRKQSGSFSHFSSYSIFNGASLQLALYLQPLLEELLKSLRPPFSENPTHKGAQNQAGKYPRRPLTDISASGPPLCAPLCVILCVPNSDSQHRT